MHELLKNNFIINFYNLSKINLDVNDSVTSAYLVQLSVLKMKN